MVSQEKVNLCILEKLFYLNILMDIQSTIQVWWQEWLLSI